MESTKEMVECEIELYLPNKGKTPGIYTRIQQIKSHIW